MSKKIDRIKVTPSCNHTEPPNGVHKGFRKQYVLVQQGEESTKVDLGFVNDKEPFLEIGDYMMGGESIALGPVSRLNKKDGKIYTTTGFVVRPVLIKLQADQLKKAA